MPAKQKRSSDLYSIVSIAIVLFLLAIYGLLFLHASNISNLIKEKINIITELKEDATEKEKHQLASIIETFEGVKSGSIEFIPKEKATEMMKEFLSEFSHDMENLPFKDVITFNLNAIDYSQDLIDRHKETLESENVVLSVYSENETVELVKNNVQKMSFVTLIIGLILVVLSLTIVYNTIKLKLHADRMEIKTMQLVGATRVFIARPYIKEASKIGLGASIIVVSLIVILLALLMIATSGIGSIVNWLYVGVVLLGVFAVGLILTVGVARYVVKGYLDTKTSDLV